MTNELYTIYKAIYREPFCNTYMNRCKLQSAVFLLQEMGFPCLEKYWFGRWSFGLYSKELDAEFRSISLGQLQTKELSFRKEFVVLLHKCRELIFSSSRDVYNIRCWAECLATLLYLRKYVMSKGASVEEVLAELSARNPDLNCKDENLAVYHLLETVFEF